MNASRLALAILLLVLGCEKTSDLPRLQDEALATTKRTQQHVEELAHRAAAIGQRAASLPPDLPDAADARRVYQRALAAIEEARRDLAEMPASVQTAVTGGKPEELAKVIDLFRERQEHTATEVISALSAYESWIAIAEQRRTAPRAAAAEPSSEPAAEPSSEPATDSGDRPPGAPAAPGR